MTRLVPAFGVVLVTVACDSNLPTAPTAPASVPQPPGAGVRYDSSGPMPIPGTDAVAGRLSEGTIGEGDPACFYNWDASARCRQFNFTPQADGRLVAILKWPEPYGPLTDPDVFLVAPDGAWVISGYGPAEKRVAIPVKSSLTYRIVVMSYVQSPQAFSLLAELQP
jgi:hypothetical protein